MQFRIVRNALLLSFFFIIATGCSEESELKEVCNQFIKGRIELKNGNATILKQITEDSLFTLLMLHEQYIRIIDAPVISPSLNIYAKKAEIKENCGNCLMSGTAYYKIHLCKDNDQWKIKGENDIYATSERISKARKKLADQKIFLKEKPAIEAVLKELNVFFDAVKLYFKTQETKALKQTCDNATLDVIQRLYKYSIERTGKDIILEEMQKPNYAAIDVDFDSTKVTCKFYNDTPEVNLQKINGLYIVSGIYGIDSKDITDKVIKQQYPLLLRSLKIIRAKAHHDYIVN